MKPQVDAALDLRAPGRSSAPSKGGRPFAKSEWKPDKISPYASLKQSYDDPDLVKRIPAEFSALLAAAGSNFTLVLEGSNPVDDSIVRFSPVYFEDVQIEGKEMPFSLLNLFLCASETKNRKTTSYRSFSADWSVKIDSLPLRENEIEAFLCLYPMFEYAMFSGKSITLADAVRECARQERIREYNRSLYSLTVLADTRMMLVGNTDKSKSQFKIPLTNLFYIRAKEPEKYAHLCDAIADAKDKRANVLLDLLAQFEIVFDGSAMQLIEKLHWHSTPEAPEGWQGPRTRSMKWRAMPAKGGQLFTCLHPKTSRSVSEARLWGILSLVAPCRAHPDLTRTFSFESVVAMAGLASLRERDPSKFWERFRSIMSHWGSYELTSSGGLVVHYGRSAAVEFSPFGKISKGSHAVKANRQKRGNSPSEIDKSGVTPPSEIDKSGVTPHYLDIRNRSVETDPLTRDSGPSGRSETEERNEVTASDLPQAHVPQDELAQSLPRCGASASLQLSPEQRLRADLEQLPPKNRMLWENWLKTKPDQKEAIEKAFRAAYERPQRRTIGVGR